MIDEAALLAAASAAALNAHAPYSRFAVGEDVWLEWLSDEVVLAKSSEERIAVTELFQKAVQDEPTSVALWSAYANWIESSHAACNNLPGSNQSG